VQHVAVDVIGAEVLERAGHRLRDLCRERRGRIVRQPVILSRQVRELGLEEHVGARDHAGAVGGGESLAHARLDVVTALIRGVDAAKARAQRLFRERGGAVFLPGGAVQEARRLH
jgi:hypothetical protein